MKKYAVLSATAFLFAVSSFAQTDNISVSASDAGSATIKNPDRTERRDERRAMRKQAANEVSYFSEQSFYHDFGKQANVNWRHDGAFDIASFDINGVVESAYYDRDAVLVGTTQYKSFSELPAAARQYINERYADYSVDGVVFFDDNEANESDMIIFNRPFEDADNYFIELSKEGKKIVLESDPGGNIQYFTSIQ
ncbi:MAG: hypothetical protein KGO82_04765 [Bacteroidota bacterium]|nr:hypothetical protein [Bacteroidota bacterium]